MDLEERQAEAGCDSTVSISSDTDRQTCTAKLMACKTDKKRSINPTVWLTCGQRLLQQPEHGGQPACGAPPCCHLAACWTCTPLQSLLHMQYICSHSSCMLSAYSEAAMSRMSQDACICPCPATMCYSQNAAWQFQQVRSRPASVQYKSTELRDAHQHRSSLHPDQPQL